MIKKFVLFIAFALSFVLVQNFAQAQDQTDNVYLARVQKQVNLKWFIPNNSDGKSAVIYFDVEQGGKISNVKVLRSSKDDAFDKSAIMAIYKASASSTFPQSDKKYKLAIFFSPLFMDTTTYVDNVKLREQNIVNVANRTSYTDFSGYESNLANKIVSNWHPKSSKPRDAVVSLRIDRDGSLDVMHQVKTSYNKDFDYSVQDAINVSIPFDNLPTGIDTANIRLSFVYDKDNSKTKTYKPAVKAEVSDNAIYFDYRKRVEKIILNSVNNISYYYKKDLKLEISINKNGKLRYVKIVKAPNDPNFNRRIVAVLRKTSFPQIPDELNTDNIVFKTEIFTQRGYSAGDFFFHYFFNFGKSYLSAYCI